MNFTHNSTGAPMSWRSHWRATPAARHSRARSAASRSSTRSSARWTRWAWTPAYVVGNSLGGYVALQLAARRGRARFARRARAGRRLGRRATSRTRRRSSSSRRCRSSCDGRAACGRDRRDPEGPPPRDPVHDGEFEHIPPELLAHQIAARAALRRLRRIVAPARGTAGASRRRGSGAPFGSSGERWTGAAGPRRRPGIGRLASPRRLGRARRGRALPATRRPTRDGPADPRLDPRPL